MKQRAPDAGTVQILLLDMDEVVSENEAEQLRAVLTQDFRRTTDAQTALRRRLAEIRTDRLREKRSQQRSR